MANTVIVIYTKDGNTKTAARLLNLCINGKVIELKEENKGSVIQLLLKNDHDYRKRHGLILPMQLTYI